MLASTSLFGCARYPERIQAPAPKATLAPFVRVFARHPSIANWEAVHRHMRLGALDERSQTAIVYGLTRGHDVAPRLFDAAAVDLATYAWGGSIETIRRENLRARREGSLDVALRTAHLAWLLLALRAGYLDDRINLSEMELRDPSRFVGRSMNLTDVNFTGSRLTSAVWRDTNLTNATFNAVEIDGRLECDACIWNYGGAPLRKKLSRGRWVP
ncbi:MAG TPA: pentapeptide repeat-containing protein [Candidatus Tumulicola sp.]